MANPHIRIKHFTGGPNGEELTKLHFQETSSDNSKFHLFKGKEQIHTEPDALSSGKDFDFVYNDLCWSITQFWISEKDEKSTGHWLSKSCDGNDDRRPERSRLKLDQVLKPSSRPQHLAR